jgi:hypothetical protein
MKGGETGAIRSSGFEVPETSNLEPSSVSLVTSHAYSV